MASLNNIGAPAPHNNARSLNDSLASTQTRQTISRIDGKASNASAVPNETAQRSRPSDTVQLSRAARAANQTPDIAELTPERAELVMSVRSQIAEESYLTDEKLNIALDRLIDDALSILR